MMIQDPALWNVGVHTQENADVILTTGGRVLKSRFADGTHVGVVLVVPEVPDSALSGIPPVTTLPVMA